MFAGGDDGTTFPTFRCLGNGVESVYVSITVRSKQTSSMTLCTYGRSQLLAAAELEISLPYKLVCVAPARVLRKCNLARGPEDSNSGK
jgi:hypothetical protein